MWRAASSDTHASAGVIMLITEPLVFCGSDRNAFSRAIFSSAFGVRSSAFAISSSARCAVASRAIARTHAITSGTVRPATAAACNRTGR